MIKACIFDLDGTIADTVESIARAGNLTLEQLGLQPQPVQNYCYYAGDGINVTLKRALYDAGDREGKNWESGIPVIRKYFSEAPMYHVKPFAGMPETLRALKEKGIRLAVVTNKPHLDAVDVVETLYGKGTFDCIQGQTSKIPIKPAPDSAWMAARQLGVEPEECLYFGDTNTDMQTGTAAGMFTVGVTWGFRPRKELEENGAMKIIDAPEEILDMIG